MVLGFSKKLHNGGTCRPTHKKEIDALEFHQRNKKICP